ncbi:MAG: hypothetical protein ACOY93_01480 [Bacillota bacterium]
MRRWQLAALLCLILILSTAAASPGVEAGDWLTKGGSPQRRSAVSDAVGQMALQEAWVAENLGQSATQPVVVGRTIYHLAGAYLWEIQVDEAGMKVAERPLGSPDPEKVNQYKSSEVLVSQSSPSLSPETGILYFGTAYGWVWAYDPRLKRFDFVRVTTGCPIVGSPLIFHENGRDFVIVSDRPNYPGEQLKQGQPPCSRKQGKVWVIENLDRMDGSGVPKEYRTSAHKGRAGAIGGFITPSAVPAGEDPRGPAFLIGADGFAGGRAIRLVLDRNQGYELVWDRSIDSESSGFAGNFTSDGRHVYWLDTKGWLWGVDLSTGFWPAGWSDYMINLPAQIGAGAAFTNTEPAVVTDGGRTHLYITLRNQVPPGQEHRLRAGPTGSEGAVLAVDPTGQVEWHRRFTGTDSINTAPLAITSQQVLLFGDVNGKLHSQSLTTANPSGGDVKPFLIPEGSREPLATLNLLKDGEQPAHGPFNFSQVSGVGVDPVMAGGLILVGVNYRVGQEAGGRLVAYRVGEPYDLRWTGSNQPLTLKLNESTPISRKLVLEETGKSLAALCPASEFAVQWYLTDPSGAPVRKLWPEVALPASIQPGAPIETAQAITLEPADPAEGQIVAVIDHPSVMALSVAHPKSPDLKLARALGEAFGVEPAKSCRGLAGELSKLPDHTDPEEGLANNILIIPYQRTKVRDDPFIATLSGPEGVVLGDRFGLSLYLGYSNNLGREAVQVRARAWASQEPGPEDYPWSEITIPAGCCEKVPITFEKMLPGVYTVTVEIDYEPDTNPANNRRSITVELRDFIQNEAPGYGSGLER